MSMVGFDIGNESCTVAVSRGSSIDIVLNDESEDQTQKQFFVSEMSSHSVSRGCSFIYNESQLNRSD